MDINNKSYVHPPPFGDEKPAGIRRKPVAKSAPALIVAKEVSINDQGPQRHDTLEAFSPSHAPASNTTIISRLQTKWSLMRKRTRVGIIAGIIVVLALIIGLSAGLAGRSRTSNLPLPNNHGGPYSGDLTYYDPALGACGFTNSGSDSIVAVSHIIFDAVSTSANPNANPLCGKKVRARRNGKSMDLTVVDRCTGCQPTDLDTTRSVFSALASIDEGRVNVEWSWLEDVPSAASGS